MRFKLAFCLLSIPFSLRSIQRGYMNDTMTKKPALILFVLLGLVAIQPAEARRDDQGGARQDVEQGKAKKLREIEAEILPRMRGMQYIGPEYDSVAQVYRLKFINKDRVIFVDVDAKTGGVIRQR